MHGNLGRFVAVVALVIGLAACSSSPSGGVTGTAQIFTVGTSTSADFATIRDAVLVAPAGSSIHIEAGLYIEALFVNKPLTLIGAGAGTVIEFPTTGQPDSAVLEIRDTVGVRIESLSIRAAPLMVDGIRVRNAVSVVLQSVIASNVSGDGIDIRNSRGVDVFDGVFESNGGDGVQVDEGSANVRIRSCRAASNLADGIKVRNSTDVRVEDNTSTLNLDDGILVSACMRVQVIGNSVTSNTSWGIQVSNSPDTILDGNTVSGNGAGGIRCEPLACPAFAESSER